MYISRRRRRSRWGRFPSGRFKISGIRFPKLPRFLANCLPKRWDRQRLLFYGGLGLIGVILLGFIGALGVFAWYARDLPSPGKLSQRTNASTIFSDRNGKVMYEMYQDKNRVPVEFKDISKHLKEATVAVEDKSFYQHGGISQTGIIRAALSTLFRGEVQGGSTITQQLIKNVLLTSERTLARKVKEAILASEVEKRYSKDEILGMYLNEAPYGGTLYGVGAAAKGYFGKEPKDLNILESAILAGLPQNPSTYSPFVGVKDAWKGRTRDVLRRMHEDGYITTKERDAALEGMKTIKFNTDSASIDAPHFVFYVSRFIEKEFGAKALEQGLRIKTTLDLKAQQIAQKIVKEEVESLKEEYNLGNGAMVMLDSKTGDILALVGSYDYENEEYGKFDVATQGLRQPGSTLKPIVFATAFEKKYTPASVLMDVETEFGAAGNGQKAYKPVNYDETFRGPVQMRFALANSLNIPAVKTLALVGMKDFLQKANDMGLTTLAPTEKNLNRFGLSIALGGGEVTLLDLTSAYTVFASGGEKRDVQFIEEIRDQSGKMIYRKPRPKAKRVFSPEVSFLISHILSDDNARASAFGRGSLLNIPGKTVAVKTGTTDEKRDNWAIGYTNDITVGVWVGNNDNTQLNPRVASGTTGATSIWHKVMVQMLKQYKDGIIEKPDGVQAQQIDSLFGGLPRDGIPSRSEYFIKGTEPDEESPFYKKLKINDGKLANEIQIKSNQYEEKEYYVITEADPISRDGVNRWQLGIDAWAEKQEDERYKPPKETSTASADDMVVQILEPANRSTIDSNDLRVRAKIISGPKIKKVRLLINGEEKRSWDGDTREINEVVNLSDGAYKVQVTAENEKDRKQESTMEVGIKKPWDWKPEAPKPENTQPPPSPTSEPSPIAEP
ncbi:MAG: PBP1A family penicillin-binding protein [Patescibacteria group bacterium]|nr:PBP1A family penicillin-binding protein [Patescibacteria group bacterium]